MAAAGLSISLVPGVTASVLGREWRCKFAEGGGSDGGLINSRALEEAQKLLDEHTAGLRSIGGVRGVYRIVCGACKDFKIIVTAPLAEYDTWEKADFAPEQAFLERLRAIPGISAVETQKYTFEDFGEQSVDAGTELALVPGVKATMLGREWRCKFTPSDGSPKQGALINSLSLEAAQQLLDSTLEQLKAIPGAVTVARTVCGGCHDFKVTIAMPVTEFKQWEATEHTPEMSFLNQLGLIDGIHTVETQTYTFATQW